MNSRRLMLIEAMLWRWMQTAIAHPRKALFLLFILCVGGFSIPAMGYLGVNTDTSQMVSSSLPHRVAQIDFERVFPEEENRIAAVVRARTADEADAFSEKLVEALQSRDDTITDVFAANLDPFLNQNALLYLESDELDETLGKISQAAPIISRLGSEPTLYALYDAVSDGLLQEDDEGQIPGAMRSAFLALSKTVDARVAGTPFPLSWQSIFAPDPENELAARQRVLSLSPVLDFSRLQPARPAVAAIKEAVAEAAADPAFEVEVGVTGTQALRSEELSAVVSGIGLSLGLSFIGVALLLFFTFRNFLLVATSLASLVISIGITAGFASLVYEDMNLVSIAFLVLMVGLGIDFAIHLGLHVQEERCAGHKTRPAMYRTTRFVGAALVLCAPTSALAFFAFSPTYFTGMAQLGIVSGFGVLVAFLVSITIMPAVFAIKRRPPMRASSRIIEHSERAMRLPRVGWLRSAAAIITLLLGVGALYLMPQVRFDADPMNLRDPNSQSVLSFDWLFEDSNTQPFNLSILEADQEAAEATAERLGELDVVKEVVTLASFVPDEQFDKLDLIEWAGIGLESAFEEDGNYQPDEGELSPLDKMLEGLRGSADPASAKLLRSFETFLMASDNDPALVTQLEGDVFRFWPRQYERLQTIIYPEEITIENLPQALRDRYVGNDGRWRVVIQPEADLRDSAARAEFVDAVRLADTRAAGSARSVLESGRVISRAMLVAVSLAMFTVTILLWLVLRDVTLVTVILFTLGLAGVLTAAAAVLLNVPFNFANVIALPLLIGVGADSGIHLGMRARRSDEAAQVYETSTPRAVFCSAMTTIVSFWTLSLSAHQGVQSMGILLTLAITMTLICTLVVQPWLLERFGAVKRAAKEVAAVPA